MSENLPFVANSGPVADIPFDSEDYIADGDAFRRPEVWLNMHWIAPS